jgi:hypothetical protein
LRAIAFLWAALHASTAGAAESLLSFPEGPPTTGEEVPLEVILYEDGQRLEGGAPDLVVEAGEILSHEGMRGSGVWRYRYLAPDTPQAVDLRVTHGSEEHLLSIPVSKELPPALDSGPIRTGRAGQTAPIRFEVGGIEPSLAEHIQVAVPEGEVLSVAGAGEKIEVLWRPGPDRFPRAIPIGFRDARQPGAAPSWTVAFLRASVTIPVRTDPGNQVDVEISGRHYGPFVADATGLASAKVQVRPGEEVAKLTLRDDLANTQRSSLSLGGDPSPGIVAIAEGVGVAGEKLSTIHVFAIRADGRAWRGEAPACQTSLGRDLRAIPSGAGAWRYLIPQVPTGSFFDIRVDCVLGARARTSIRVPVESPPASALQLRVYPGEISADRPVAQVEAFLERGSGERVPSMGIELEAELGSVQIMEDESGPAATRGIYAGEAAVAAGGDTIRARWNLPKGSGGAWSLTAAGSCGKGEAHCLVRARASDRLGRPLQGVSVDFHSGGTQLTSITGDSGWASASLSVPAPDDPFVCVLRTGTVEREIVLFEGESTGAEPDAPDLVDEFIVGIRSGRVRNVSLLAEPNPMYAGRDVNARIRLRLVDADGAPVQDETMEIRATEGVITKPRYRGGAYEATWAPRPGMARGTVQITATSGDELFVDTTTELEVSPRPMNTGIGMEGGWIWGADGISSPWLAVHMDRRAAGVERPIFGRFELGAYQLDSIGIDEEADQIITVELDTLPIGMGLLYRQEQGRVSTWLGGSLRVLPYRIQVYFADQQPISQRGVAPPGGSLYAGAGWRLLSSELYAQLSYELLSMPGPEVGFTGSIGGVSIRTGYKILF